MTTTRIFESSDVTSVWPDYVNAAHLNPDELWRLPGNSGREYSPGYVDLHQLAQKQFVGWFESGELYQNPVAFTEALNFVHGMLSPHYENHGGSGTKLEGQYGRLDNRPGRFPNTRLQESLIVAKAAEYYGDPYYLHEDGTPGRFVYGPANGEDRKDLRLDGIHEGNWPHDTVRYDAEGAVMPVIRQPREDRYKGGYHFLYPDISRVDEYLYKMWEIGSQIEQVVKSGEGNTDEVLALIARQYQYGACARPYRQVNNSLLMDLVNVQVKLLGLPGLTHGIMDIAAQRMQPENFVRYFIDRAHGIEVVDVPVESLPK